MLRLQRCAPIAALGLSALIVLTFVMCSSTAGRGVRLAPSGFERVGTGPSLCSGCAMGSRGIVDTLANSVAFIDNAGRVVGRAGLPAAFIVSATQQEDGRILLLSGDKNSAIEIARTIDPASAGALTAQPLARPRAAPAEVVRRNKWQLTLPSVARPGRAARPGSRFARSPAIRWRMQHEIGVDTDGRRYVLWSEFVSANPDVVVRAFVGRYGLDGRLMGIAEVPLSDMDYVPDEYAMVTRAGELRVMVPTRSGVEIRTIPMREIPAVNPRSATRMLPSRACSRRLQSEKGRALKVETRHRRFTDKLERRNDLPSPRHALLLKPIARAKVLELAREFVTQEWTLGDKNYQQARHLQRLRQGSSVNTGSARAGCAKTWSGRR